MRPVLEEQKNNGLKTLYIVVIIICAISIGVGVYLQFFSEEKLDVILGINQDDSKDKELELENQFGSIFTNQLDVLDNTQINVKKEDANEIVYAKFNKSIQKDNCTIDVKIPYINIDEETTKRFNTEIQNEFKSKVESIYSSASKSQDKYIYTVNYKAYVQNDILSLIIKSELKENDSEQQVTIKTYNYNLKDSREEKLEDLLNLRDIEIETANKKIQDTIKNKQEKNKNLTELGYNVYQRDLASSIYYVNNSEVYLYGENGTIYIIYAYGNLDFTSEMDLVIL